MENKFKKVSIIGYGNVGSHLVEAFYNIGIQVTHVLVRNSSKYQSQDNIFTSKYSELPFNQLVIICVPDDSVVDIIKQIDESCPIAYTSGSVKLESLHFKGEVGVFYPLQSFTKGISVNMTEVPFFIESNSVSFGKSLFQLASLLSNNVKYANSDVRSKLHLAAVWVNNFTNHINYIAKDYLDNQELDFEDLKPLLKETIRKIESNSPFEVQTGPARRGDTKTIEKHLTMLNEKQKEIYQLLTESIQKTYSKNDKL